VLEIFLAGKREAVEEVSGATAAHMQVEKVEKVERARTVEV
jgi:hypothetical protein